MARKRKIEPDNEPEGDGMPDELPATTPEISEDISRLEAILKSNDLRDGDVMIFRRGRNDLKPQYMGAMPISEFSVDEISSKFGGGKYNFKFRDLEKRIVTATSFEIDPRIKGSIDDAPPPAPVAPPPPAAPPTDFMQFMLSTLSQNQQMLQQSNQNMVQIVTAALGRREEPRPDPFAALAPIIAAVSPIIGKAMESKGPAGSVKEILDVVKHVRSLGGKGGDDDDKPDAITGIIQAVGAMLQARAGQPQAQPLPPTTVISDAAPLPAGFVPAEHLQSGVNSPAIAPGPASDPSPMTPTRQLQAFARAQLPALQRAAQRGSDPVSYADVLLDQFSDLEPTYIAFLMEELRKPDWTQRVFGEKALPFQPWFDQLRESLIEEEPKEEAKP